jgi:hypothetical protein
MYIELSLLSTIKALLYQYRQEDVASQPKRKYKLFEHAVHCKCGLEAWHSSCQQFGHAVAQYFCSAAYRLLPIHWQ